MLVFEVGAERRAGDDPVHIVGIDPKGRAAIGGFAEYLTDPARQARPVVRPATRPALRRWAAFHPPRPGAGRRPPIGAGRGRRRPTRRRPSRCTPDGAVVGYAIAHYRVDRSGDGQADRQGHPAAGLVDHGSS